MYRQALQELSSSPYMMRGADTDSNLLFIADAFFTSSPEEQIIQLRRRRMAAQAVVFQYDELQSEAEFTRTPSKEGGLSQLSRKRLLLTPKTSSVKKAKRLKLTKNAKRTELKTQLTGYGAQELVDVIDQLIEDHPELEQEVRDTLHQPDIKPLEEKLLYLRRNVYRALPTNRWETSRDVHAYRRVKLHLESFKRTCLEQGKKLIASQCWEAVVKYVLVAWKYVHQLPQWDNPSHNAVKLTSFRILAAYCMIAVKRGGFTKLLLIEIKERLNSVASMSEEIQPCVGHVEKLLT